MSRTLCCMADTATAKVLVRFFKTGPGEYGEGDRFHGIRVPQLRKLVSLFASAPLSELIELLHSPFHEERLLSLLVMARQFEERASGDKCEAIYRAYRENSFFINNWDLVDLSAPRIVGRYLFTRSRPELDLMAVSPLIWDRRIAIVATLFFIRNDRFDETLRIAKRLLADCEDLIRKATGWMLREVGKRDMATLERFLYDNMDGMSRITLRYAIERFPEKRRQEYLKGTVSLGKKRPEVAD